MTNPQAELVLTIDADRFDDIPGFYQEINRIFMAGEDWQLGQSLDALDDLLYRGYGAAQAAQFFRLEWKNMDKSRHDLGLKETRQWLLKKLDHPEQFNTELIRKQLTALDLGEGPTFFEIVMEIFGSHSTVELVEI